MNARRHWKLIAAIAAGNSGSKITPKKRKDATNLSIAQLSQLIDRKDGIHIAYPAFRKRMVGDPSSLASLSSQQFAIIISAVIRNLGGIANHYGIRDRAECAMAILDLMDSLNIKPEQYSFEVTIHIHSHLGDIDSIQKLLVIMRQLDHNVQTDHIMRSLIRAHILAKDDQTATTWFNKMREQDPTSTKPFNVLIESLLKRNNAGDQQRVQNLIDQMKRDGPKPDLHFYEMISFQSFLSGKHQKAVEWVTEYMSLNAKSMSAKLYSVLLSVHNFAGEHIKALGYIQQMKQDGIQRTGEVYRQQIIAYAGLGNRDMAWRVYGRTASRAKPTESIVRAMVQMEGPLTPTSLASIDQSIIENHLDRFHTLSQFAIAYSQVGDLRSTMEAVRQCEITGRKTIPYLRSRIVHVYANQGDPESALNYAEAEIKSTDYRISFGLYYMMLVAAYRHRNDTAIARQYHDRSVAVNTRSKAVLNALSADGGRNLSGSTQRSRMSTLPHRSSSTSTSSSSETSNETISQTLVGTTILPATRLIDLDGHHRLFFVFNDITVRVNGAYRIKCQLMHLP
eukprot:jgi/Hompol1/1529/HPOL_004975-RA